MMLKRTVPASIQGPEEWEEVDSSGPQCHCGHPLSYHGLVSRYRWECGECNCYDEKD